jgi:hypothetical protein
MLPSSLLRRQLLLPSTLRLTSLLPQTRHFKASSRLNKEKQKDKQDLDYSWIQAKELEILRKTKRDIEMKHSQFSVLRSRYTILVEKATREDRERIETMARGIDEVEKTHDMLIENL